MIRNWYNQIPHPALNEVKFSFENSEAEYFFKVLKGKNY